MRNAVRCKVHSMHCAVYNFCGVQFAKYKVQRHIVLSAENEMYSVPRVQCIVSRVRVQITQRTVQSVLV